MYSNISNLLVPTVQHDNPYSFTGNFSKYAVFMVLCVDTYMYVDKVYV